MSWGKEMCMDVIVAKPAPHCCAAPTLARMKQRVFHPRKMDVGVFIESGEPLAGDTPVVELSRLCAGLPQEADVAALGPVRWQVQGRTVPQYVIEAQIFEKLALIPDIRAFKLNDRGERDISYSILAANEADLNQAVAALEEALRTREGIRGAVFHEGMSILERDKASAYFAQAEGGAQVLLCSEIGSEGRNFQFASHLVLFDLPLNPDLLEQRIGRQDRIGQQNTVEIHVPYLEGTSQRALQLWYHDGLDAFEQTCPTARPVFEAVRDELFELLAANTGDQATLDALLIKTRELHEPLKARLEQGRDRLLEIHSSGGAAAQQRVDKLAAEDDDTGMISFALKMFDEIGVNQDDRGENALVLTPGDHMLVSSFPGLPQDGMTITFDRPTALSRDDMALLSWDHPMMRGGIDLILGSEIGATSVALLKNKALPIGSILLELIFVAESAAHPQLYRFMPPTPIRLLMDKNGQNLGEKVAFDAFNRQLTPVNRHLGSKLVTASQPVIHGLIGKGQAIAEELKAGIVDKARTQMAQTLQQDLDRLEALKAVNPNVRDSELDYLRNLQAELHHLIDQTQLKLDAIRFIVVTHN